MLYDGSTLFICQLSLLRRKLFFVRVLRRLEKLVFIKLRWCFFALRLHCMTQFGELAGHLLKEV